MLPQVGVLVRSGGVRRASGIDRVVVGRVAMAPAGPAAVAIRLDVANTAPVALAPVGHGPPVLVHQHPARVGRPERLAQVVALGQVADHDPVRA